MGSKISLLDKKNFNFSLQISAGLMPKKIGKWSVGVGRRNPSAIKNTIHEARMCAAKYSAVE